MCCDPRKFGLTYSYGAAGSNNGQIASITDYVDNGRSATYTYDALHRLTRAITAGSGNYAAWGLSETYDRYGNRSAQSIYSGCTGITCPTNSVNISATTNQITGSPYAYDLGGNMTNDGSNTLVYDAENRAVSANHGGASGTYTYDGNGLRVKKISGSTTTVYVFSGSKVIAEYDNGAPVGSPSREYIYGGAPLLAKIDSSGTKYYHQDHLSNRLVTDSSGNTYAQMGHFPFGEKWYNATNDKLFFTTYERDSESGNDYAMARYYASRLGRFLPPDALSGSIDDPQSLNHYAYVQNDAVNFLDPTGMYVAGPGQCDNSVVQNCLGGDGGGWSEAAIFAFAFTPTGWGEDGPIMGNLGALDLLGPDPGQFYGGPMDVGGLRGNALVALLNPDCANLFGGFKNAVTSLFNSSYNMYVPGEANPYPNRISSQDWTSMVNYFGQNRDAYGRTFWSSARRGGVIFFTAQFNTFAPGFPSSPSGFSQMTAFFHEQEHAANHNSDLDTAIDANTAAYTADYKKINTNCTPKQIETQSVPITGELTPP